ncbi:MAG: phage BR0599 family protein [Desulfovibrionaceae bacterium]
MSADVELYRFELGGQVWRWTSADADQELDGETYAVLDGLGREALEQTGEAARASLVVQMPATAQPAALFTAGVPDGVIRLTVRRRSDGTWRAIWRGRVLSCAFGGVAARLTGEPWFSGLGVPGPRRTCGPSCPHDFCDWHCGLAPEAWTATGRVSAVDGAAVTLPAAAGFADGAFAGGVLAFGNARREVLAHAGAELTLARACAGLTAGVYTSVLAGCDKTPETCAARDNLVNHGGCPNVPAKDPCSGDPII